MNLFKKVSKTACPYCGEQTMQVMARQIELLDFCYKNEDQSFNNTKMSLELACKCKNPNCKHYKDVAADISPIDNSIQFIPTDNDFIERVHEPLKQYTVKTKRQLKLSKPPKNSFDTEEVLKNSEFVKHE